MPQPSANPASADLHRHATTGQDPLRSFPLHRAATALGKSNGDDQVREGELKAAQAGVLDVMRCKWAADAEHGIRAALDRPIAPDADSLASAGEEKKIKLLQDNLSRLTALRANCPAKSDEALDADVYDKLLSAARLGDQNAASCYIVASYEAPSLQADAASSEQYRTNAVELIQNGIAAGDWTMVYLLESGSSPNRGSGGWFNSLLIHDDLTTYKYRQLRRLGTEEEAAHDLDAQLAQQAQQLVEHNRATAEDIRQANQWAQQMYVSYFAGSKRLKGSPHPCRDPTGGLQATVM